MWSTPPGYTESGYTYYGHEYYPSHHTRHDVMDFINSNTVNLYFSAVDSKRALEVAFNGSRPTEVPGHSGWYYDSSRAKTYTYVFEDNKAILSNGWILTYMDGKLYKDGDGPGTQWSDGASTTLSPW